ncbi:hypothetical protein [Streptomyces albipurpureus]|uniref:Uncharacterized protein n=1 Tax=Streptomyces albipurpureus TaxID=2897419 RepID=A0ABT0UUZ3_9ACTN|nr:hypothetical protein [Streptomyces sp. CWNU-1]MCM2392264.1 hypothetical protein [Streptomyces sp. CWNU-1]
MIPGEHRLKGGAFQFGADDPGLPRPFGAWTDHDGQDDEHEPAEDLFAEPHS